MKYAIEILKTRAKKISELKTELESLFFSYPANSELKSKYLDQESNNLLLKFLEKLNKIQYINCPTGLSSTFFNIMVCL